MPRSGVVLSLLAVACAHGTEREGTQYVPSADVDLAEAEALVAEFEHEQSLATMNDPLRHPKSVEDVWEILKRDQMDLFPAGVEWANGRNDVESRLVVAQTELAWSDAQYVLSMVLTELAFRLSQTVRPLEADEATGDLDAPGREKLARLRSVMSRNERLVAALKRLSREHMWRGAKIARTLVDDVPRSYAGYRLMADFYRLRGDWRAVDEMLDKAEEKNPASNGVAFLRGVEALEHKHDGAGAQKLFRQALERDPEFVRARVWLLLTYANVADAMDDYEALRAKNPHHQLVVWAGPLIEQAADREKQDAR